MTEHILICDLLDFAGSSMLCDVGCADTGCGRFVSRFVLHRRL